MVPSYRGTSPYLLLTKYNNYAGIGSGNGQNRLAILDPNGVERDPVSHALVMREVLTILGPTPDDANPGGVREWCINSAAVDPFTRSVLANSEDGSLYRWDLVSNSFTESMALTTGVGEAYTPTAIGVDGTVYAINNATLFAVGRFLTAAASAPADSDVTTRPTAVGARGIVREADRQLLDRAVFAAEPAPALGATDVAALLLALTRKQGDDTVTD
jgi:hypothetical protein